MLNSRLYAFSSLLFYILFFRASLDPLLNLTKVGGIGLGALLNLLVVMIFFIVCFKKGFLIPNTFISVWGGFLILGLVSIVFSPDKMNSLRSFFSILTYWSVFCLSYFFIKDRRDGEYFIKFIIYSAVIPITFVFFEFIFPESSTTRNGFRLFGSFSHPNIFAFYLVLIGTLCMYSIKSAVFCFSHKFLTHAKIIFITSMCCLLLTQTRSAWLAMIVMFLIYGILAERSYLLYLFALVVLSLLIPSVQERVFDIFSGPSGTELPIGESLNSYEWRKVVWLSSWDYIANKPFFGHGYDTFSYYFLDFFPLQEKEHFDAHNAYVQIAFDMGFLGVISYLTIFILLIMRFMKFFKVDRKGASLILGLIASYMVAGYSDNMLFYLSYNWYFWSVMGLFYFYSLTITERKSVKSL